MVFKATWLTALLLAGQGVVWAQDAKPPQRIYSCTTAEGRRLTSDRPIPECASRAQQLHRHDGSVRAQVPPAMSPEEMAAAELRERERAAQRAALADATRFDRNLLARYPREAQHDQARKASLDAIVTATNISERRIKDLQLERKKIDDEAEFYAGQSLPSKLKRQIDANDAARDAQKIAIGNQAAERDRTNRRYDLELQRLKRLWAGAPAGSLGPAPSAKDWELPAAKAPAAAVRPGAPSAAR